MKAFGLALASKLQADEPVLTNVGDGTPQRKSFLRAYQNPSLIQEVLGETRGAQDGGDIEPSIFQFRAKGTGNSKMLNHNHSPLMTPRFVLHVTLDRNALGTCRANLEDSAIAPEYAFPSLITSG